MDINWLGGASICSVMHLWTCVSWYILLSSPENMLFYTPDESRALSLYLCSIYHVGFFWSGGRLCLVSWLNICPVCLSSEERQEKTKWMYLNVLKSYQKYMYCMRYRKKIYRELYYEEKWLKHRYKPWLTLVLLWRQSIVRTPVSLNWFKRLDGFWGLFTPMSLLKPFIYFYYAGSERRAGI